MSSIQKQTIVAAAAVITFFGAIPTQAQFATQNSRVNPTPPSQQYRPMNNAPPAVYVPDSPQQTGGGQVRASQHRDNATRAGRLIPDLVPPGQYLGEQPQQTRQDSKSYNFSDTPSSAFRESYSGGSAANIRQATHNEPVTERQVSRQPDRQTTSENALISRDTTAKQLDAQNTGTQASYLQQRGSMQPEQDRNTFPVVDSEAFENHRQMIANRLQAIKQHQQQIDGDSIDAAASSSQTNSRIATAEYQAPQGFVEPVEYVNFTENSTNAQNTAPNNQAESTTENSTAASLRDEFAGEPKNEMAQLRAETADFQQTSDKPEFVKQVSNDSNARNSNTSVRNSHPNIDLWAPAIRVQTFGSQSIGINKVAQYRVVITNDGNRETDGIRIGFNIPDWIDLQNIEVSNGRYEITSGTEQARVVWNVEQVPATSSHSMTINAVPKKAEAFDLRVNWTFVPKSGVAQVQVTEPRLEMKIAGPNEVLYGEKAVYQVTVRNPGTGTAENVIVMLPEALGGARDSLGNIPAGSQQNFQVELFARTAGALDLSATAIADGGLEVASNRQIQVRRANLTVTVQGPPLKYSGSIGNYVVTITNDGDATATEVVAAMALPNGIKYVSGLNGAQTINSGLRWNVGTMNAGDQRTFDVQCKLDAAGDLQIEAGARATGDLAASGACITTVETIADLVLNVDDPKGPLPTGEGVVYQIRVQNRGTRTATDVNVVMQFSDGIEPTKADGLKYKLVPGQVLFDPISRVEPGQVLVLQVTAQAHKSGTHIFRAQMTCTDSDSREIKEGTTRFFGDDISSTNELHQQLDDPNKQNTADAENSSDSNDFDR
jgi:uncharacterized repeat protein (TIGR01451 family)